MPKGGARNKSGPARDLDSGRTERLGIVLTDLPAAGSGIVHVPEFPLPVTARYEIVKEDKEVRREKDRGETEAFREREVDIWNSLWALPQGIAWEREPWRWYTIADYCRAQTVFETDPDKSAAFLAQIARLKDDIGLTSAGMRFLGWAVKHDEMSKRRGAAPVAVADEDDDPRDRMAGGES